MNATGYFTKFDVVRGSYQPTEVDEYKAKADFLIVGVGNRWEIFVQNHIDIKENRSIKRVNDKTYFVTDKALEELKAKYTYACDF